MSAPVGNKYAIKNRLLEQTLRRVVLQDDGKRLRQACEAVLTKAAKGDLAAYSLLADRLDGRVRADDSGNGDDVKSISLDQLMRAILQARAADAVDGQVSTRSLTHEGSAVDVEATREVNAHSHNPVDDSTIPE